MFKFLKKKKIGYTFLPRKENYSVLNNPYSGFYTIYRFFAESNIRHDDDSLLYNIELNDNRLCLIEINLINFNDKSLSEKALKNIREIFDFFIKNDKQLILRFVYDWVGKGITSEPKDISIILDHMQQLSNILKDYDQYIYIIQGLFIGSWGEMHNSRYLGEHHIIALSNKLYDSVGENVQIALRSPSFLRSIFKTNKPLNKEEYIQDVKKARYSLFNDAIMASKTDLGTYGDIKEKDSKNYSDKWIREDELKYQNNHCLFVSNGGEVVYAGNMEIKSSYTIIETLRKMRISYLHDEYDARVLDNWKKTILDSSFRSYKGKTLYEYIAIHLGYRFTIEDVILVKDRKRNKNINIKIANTVICLEKPKRLLNNEKTINIIIINTGFAPSYVKYDVWFIIKDITNQQRFEYYIDTDTRFWYPMERVTLHVSIDLSILKFKEYQFGIKVHDKRLNEYIELNKTFDTMDCEGYYYLGHIKIKE